jgi:hypothetical protein
MRRSVLLLLAIVVGAVLLRDMQLAVLWQHGELEFAHTVIDRTENGIITKSHDTQLPSAEDAILLVFWTGIHIGIVAFSYLSFSRSRLKRSLSSPVSEFQTSASVPSRSNRAGPRKTTYWIVFSVVQLTGVACIAFAAGVPTRIAPALASLFLMLPGSLVVFSLESLPLLVVATVFNFAAWCALWRSLNEFSEPSL